MKKIVTIGELLIDFIPNEKGVKLKDVNSFTKHAGGAPANVSVAAKKNGSDAYFIGQVGKDAFGDFLIDELVKEGIDSKYILQTNEAKTTLAFVSLASDGERDFSFYRNPSADQLYSRDKLPKELLNNALLHFCSVSLQDYPIKDAHKEAINYVRETNGFVSFDLNVRLSLWDDHVLYKNVINEFIEYSDLIKLSDDELAFISDETDQEKAIRSLFKGHVKYIILTLGAKGSKLYLKDNLEPIIADSIKVDTIDTTGAGDAFIGTFISEMNKRDLDFSKANIEDALKIANVTGALTTTKHGGISSIPTYSEVKKVIN